MKLLVVFLLLVSVSVGCYSYRYQILGADSSREIDKAIDSLVPAVDQFLTRVGLEPLTSKPTEMELSSPEFERWYQSRKPEECEWPASEEQLVSCVNLKMRAMKQFTSSL